MAILSSDSLSRIRQDCAKAFSVIAYTKPQINTALQAIEDAMISRVIVPGDLTKTLPLIITTDIDVATAPFIFSVLQKKSLFALWARLKFERDV